MTKILLLVPCYNEESRLKFNEFSAGALIARASGIELTYLFVNDGSTDQTKHLLENYATEHGHRTFHAAKNLGKGNALQAAFRDNKATKGFDWIGYWDADLATPLEEIPSMLQFLNFYPNQEVSSIWGSRISRLGSRIRRQMHRHYLGRVFVTIVSTTLKVKAYDSQCGAKLFKPEAAELAFAEPFISRWIFDVEILLRLRNHSIVEFPLFNWEDIPGSKVKVFKEAFRVGSDLLKIRRKYLQSL